MPGCTQLVDLVSSLQKTRSGAVSTRGGPGSPFPSLEKGLCNTGDFSSQKEGILGKEGNSIHQAGTAVSPKEREVGGKER